MARHHLTQRLGRTRPRDCCAAALAAASLTSALLAGCAPLPQDAGLAMSPYQISIGRFTDDRFPEVRAKDALMPTPFDHQQLLARLLNDIPASPMNHTRAVLDLHLLEYQSARDDNGTFGLTMTVRLDTYRVTVPGMPVQPITHLTATCHSGLQLNGPDVATAAQQDLDVARNALNQRDLFQLSDKNQDNRHWHTVFDACVDQLARQYDEALMSPLAE